MWSFARDRAFPFSATWAKVNKRLGVPLNAHIACNAIVVLLGALYIASATGMAFSFHSCSVQLLGHRGYCIPVSQLLNPDYSIIGQRTRYSPARTFLPRKDWDGL